MAYQVAEAEAEAQAQLDRLVFLDKAVLGVLAFLHL
jgi:hypothetical protein